MTTMTRTENITLETFTPAHLEGAYALSQAVQWPHRIEDWALSLTVSKAVVALADGQVVGTAICSIFGDIATFNMIIVDERLRGHGLGRKLMEAIFKIAGGRELRLVATQEGLPLYEKLGFRATGEIVQHQGKVTLPSGGVQIEHAVTSVSPENMTAEIETFAKYDAAATGMFRAGLLRDVSQQDPQDTALFKCDGGYALVRRFGRGYLLGPIVASDASVAKSLVAAAVTHSQGRFLRIDIPQGLGLSGDLESYGMPKVGGGTVMVANPKASKADAVETDMKTYALFSQALG